MDRKKRCKNCRGCLDLNSHVKSHEYCNRKACQQERKRCRQRQKMVSDPDYRENQKNAQIKWRQANPDYWRKYRREHDKYLQRHRLLQKKREAKRRTQRLAKKDGSAQKVLLIPDSYTNYVASCKEGLDLLADRLCLGCIKKETKPDDFSAFLQSSP